ncbi:DegT/DnrJ/EryC1/StrS aminotransferase family protein, partial [candidate division WOR-3 bacterium]|nr:DegT/DnrJ/EryC1/StrS aminotransferase family protein [candidate division WOR-3 bacterium]
MRDKFLPFGSPLIEQPEIDEVVASLKSGWLGTGPKVHKFEEMFREYKGVKFAMALNSCTAALHLSMLALGLKPGDEVLVPTMTFASTANAVIHAGGKPILVDCKKDTMNIDPEDIERKITSKTKAIIPVHYAGQSCDMDEIIRIAQEFSLKVIEDAAHSFPTKYKDRMIGTIGEITCFSFYPTKPITTGEGGMACTENDEFARRMKIMSLHGISKDAWKRYTAEGSWYYEVIEAGYKYNMTDIQASLGIHQLRRVEQMQERREGIARRYNKEFEDMQEIIIPTVKEYVRPAWHLYPIQINTNLLKIDR